MPLPGPTGETNILSLHPRGVILCIGSFSDVKRQMYKALLMDNSVIVHAASGHETIESPSQTLIKESALENLISLIDRAAVRDLINGPIDGVAADGQYRTELAEFLCRREGPILPILSANSELYRFCHERTVTQNTTATGGNASLLTL